MKKDIEWLKAQICTEMMYLEHIRKERWSGVKYQTLRSVSQKINQLDETEVLSQEWIDEHKVARVNNLRKMTMSDVVPIDDLQNLLVPKQELPVIPKHVAKYLEFAKSDVSLIRVMVVAYSRDELPEWEQEYDWISENSETFARAWLNGYEVEEQKYYVEDGKHTLLCKWESSDGWKVISTMEATEDGLHTDTLVFELTEQEIKDFDPRYWAFRKPV